MLPTGTDAGGPITLLSTAISEVFGEKGTIAINGVTDIDSIELRTVADKKTTQLAEAKAKFNLMEEAEEFHRLIVEKDVAGLQALAQLSRDVVAVTEDLRRSNNIIYPADK
ncbi:protein of unknown function [Taphrina deformans PYCC 5710]|uniref:Uncharacterized protein n=1 Tax=Taphrina deformans (strain PYCC 5710 / ATCC 11124 / CBS 356.35 / IMI 108563 / JCM 9778 / NBRC 8474) TaxID=1097556 RepID=R4X8E2_TAPDE|nr:protein of unknown function [Taphrina deformans PYCC 5710]|eukprot:CCG81843.1 protein of unknown function [Taphrina deformans PYCC 5710]